MDRVFALGFVLAPMVLLTSCGGTYYVPTDSTVGSLTAKQARASLAADLKESKILTSGHPVPLTDVRVAASRLVVTDASGKQSVFKYRDLPPIAVGLGGFDIGWLLLLGGQETFSIGDHKVQDRDSIPNALHVLQRDAIRSEKAAEEFDLAFAASLASYRQQAASNAALPEEAIKYKVQAEGAVHDKDFDGAAELYAAALNVTPWWPAGHFNRALVLGEIGDYESARREMGYYLKLVPEAPNARAAQDKVYQWERLEAK